MPSFSKTLEQAIHASLAVANTRRHEIATLEHLLLALIDEPDAAKTMQACSVDLGELRETVEDFIEDDLSEAISDVEGSEAVPTEAFQRVIQRAAIHVQSSGRTEVTGANVLVAIFAERESNAAYFLQEQNMTRYDAVNFIAHGVAKDPAFGEPRPLPDWEDLEEEEEEGPAEELLTEAEWQARYAEIEAREAEIEAQKAIEARETEETDFFDGPKAVGQRARKSVEHPFVFLSYSSEDREFASGFLSQIENRGMPFWWDQNIDPGDEWRARIAQKLEAATVVLTLWTQNSIASKAVIEEASRAQAERKLVHVRIDDSEIPYGFAETQYVDLRDWDGSENHQSLERLFYAVQDKLAVPSVGFATTRIRESSPVEVVARNGRLAVLDAPANAPSIITNQADLEKRLSGLRQTISSMCQMCSDSTAYQLPPTLHHCLEAIKLASFTEPVTWYALEDAKTLLHDCMVDNFAAESWNTVVYKGLNNLTVRIDEIKPLLHPVQIDPKTNAARPPSPEPIIEDENISDVIGLAEEIKSEFTSEEGQAVIDENTGQLMESALSQLRDLRGSQDPSRLFKVRRSVKNITFLVGGLVTAIGTGVVVNLLTAPAAATTLLGRLKPMFDSILQFFM